MTIFLALLERLTQWCAFIALSLGGILFLITNQGQPMSAYQKVPEMQLAYHAFSAQPALYLLNFGLLVLIASQSVKVLRAIQDFLETQDWPFACVSLVVFILLCTSLLRFLFV